MSRETLPVVAIVGRPNVGKSSFLNHVAGRLISIVEPTPGVTRDRICVTVTVGDRQIELVDTGGIGITDVQDLSAHVEAQIGVALEMADAVVFLTDARDGIAPLDLVVAERLRRLAKPTLLVVNKADTPLLEETAMEFHRLGLGEPVPMSIHQRFNTTEVTDRIRDLLIDLETPATQDPSVLRLAFVGKRNSGKSTFVNALAREERVITSEIPGTTRDAVDVRFEKDGQVFVAVDTAGLRRRKSIQGDIDFYAQVRTERALRMADVVLLIMDAPSEISGIDKKIGEMVAKAARPVVLVINKWDLAESVTTPEDYEEYIQKMLPDLHFSPLVFTSASTGRNVWRAVEVAQNLHEQAGVRVPTAEVNRILIEAQARQRPFSSRYRSKKTGKILYGAQVAVRPPTFVLFVNDRKCFEDAYLRYLSNIFRDTFGFSEIPLRIILRERAPRAIPDGLPPKTMEEEVNDFELDPELDLENED